MLDGESRPSLQEIITVSEPTEISAEKALQIRYEKSIRYGIDLQRAIEAHCRGARADEETCPHHSKMLNARLDSILAMFREGQ